MRLFSGRTGQLSNWRVMRFSHVIANFALALWCGLLAGRWFKDLAPLRLIDRELFEAIAPQEKTFGWTIEPQVVAARLGAAICEVPASERPRLAGAQKVSGVTWRRTFSIGCRILAAGFRARLRFQRRTNVEFGRSGEGIRRTSAAWIVTAGAGRAWAPDGLSSFFRGQFDELSLRLVRAARFFIGNGHCPSMRRSSTGAVGRAPAACRISSRKRSGRGNWCSTHSPAGLRPPNY